MNRTFFCLACRVRLATEDGKPPLGWLSLAILIAEGSEWRAVSAFSRIGLFCSLACLISRAPMIAREIGEELPEAVLSTAAVAAAS